MTLDQLRALYPHLEDGEPSDCSECGASHSSCEVITDEGGRIYFLADCSGEMELIEE